jgi:hypothetical protein
MKTGLALALLLVCAAPGLAYAQGAPAPVSRVEKQSATVTVVKVDAATRHLIIKTPAGENYSLKISPDVRNLENVKAGDKISVVYYRETEIAIARAGKPLPKDAATLAAARAQPGELPAGLIASHVVVTGAVLGIDTARSRLKVVSPSGGEVHDVDVITREGRELMGKLKVGDKVTLDVGEALLIGVHRD